MTRAVCSRTTFFIRSASSLFRSNSRFWNTRHLISDQLGWFKDSHEPKTVEEMVAAHGGRIRRGHKYIGGIAGQEQDQGETIEIESDSQPDVDVNADDQVGAAGKGGSKL